MLMAACQLAPTAACLRVHMVAYPRERTAAYRVGLEAGCLPLRAIAIEATFHRGPIFFEKWRREACIKLPP